MGTTALTDRNTTDRGPVLDSARRTRADAPGVDSDKVSELGDVNVEGLFDSLQCSEQQAALLKKYEDYLMSIAIQEMRTGLHRKFGPSDVVQQTYCLAVNKVAGFRGKTEEQFRGWLRSILLNQMRQNERDLYRIKRDVRKEQPLTPLDGDGAYTGTPELTDQRPTPSTNATSREEDERLHDALSNLPDDYQTVIRLRNWGRLQFAEIGKRMNRSETSVQKLWYRAILKLQAELGVHDE